jgi:fructosamine-3-kinase
VAVHPDRIELPRLTETGASPSAAEDLGRRLAVTHGAGAPAFGSPPDGWEGPGWIGSIPLPYGSFRTWGAFYAERRLLPYARSAADAGSLSRSDVRAVEAVCARLVAGEWDDGRAPARLHGDLWSGNVLWCRDGAVLVDPAAHGGHAETDLAMLALFGLPHLERVLAAYDESAPLADGWRDRVGLHQLHPLLVHAVLFGGGYGVRAGELARRYA